MWCDALTKAESDTASLIWSGHDFSGDKSYTMTYTGGKQYFYVGSRKDSNYSSKARRTIKSFSWLCHRIQNSYSIYCWGKFVVLKRLVWSTALPELVEASSYNERPLPRFDGFFRPQYHFYRIANQTLHCVPISCRLLSYRIKDLGLTSPLFLKLPRLGVSETDKNSIFFPF